MCKFMQVTRSSYYDWLSQAEAESAKEAADKLLLEEISSVFVKGRSNYGSRSIKKILFKANMIVSRLRIVRLMKEAGLVCQSKRKFKATTNSRHNKPVAPNLLDRNFTATAPNLCYVGDITYISTGEGWLYLATVIDLYSRRIVGWSMSNNIKTELVNNALLMAIFSRKPAKGLIWHTDRGSQYVADSHLKIIAQHGIIQSMEP